jgi:hypothetical protein
VSGASQVPVQGARGLAQLDPGELEARYRAYRRNQASMLAKVLPREAVRPLYRRARERAGSAPDDPLAVLVSLCEELLPLPPFDVWKADLFEHPEGHLSDLGDWAEAPVVERPLTLALRSFSCEGSPWLALLRAYRDGGGWRGSIAFKSRTGKVFRTTDVFHEPDPTELESRFSSFDEPALHAFLRSALP